MEFIFRFDLSIFAVLLLVALLVVILSKQELLTPKSRIFRYVIYTTIFMLIVEIFSWVFDGVSGEMNRFFNHLFNFLFTGFSTLIVSLWAAYLDNIIHDDTKRLKKRLYYMHPTIIMLVLAVINIFYPILFVISDENVYSRLPLISISLGLSAILYIYILVLILRNKKYVNSRVLIGVMIFLLLPMIAAAVQLTTYGLLLLWPATAIALVFSYLIFETTSSSRDFLTGAYTRMRAEVYIQSLLKRNKKFAVVMVDLDDFKLINDTFGHHVGDDMLVEMVIILKTVFKKKAIVSRYGGDEFLIVVEGALSGDMNLARKSIETRLKSSESIYAQNQKFSYGVSLCENRSLWTLESIITAADNNMYFDKAKNKNKKRRKSDRS